MAQWYRVCKAQLSVCKALVAFLAHAHTHKNKTGKQVSLENVPWEILESDMSSVWGRDREGVRMP